MIQAELTLGQLVAAELVLSAAFFGVAQLGNYLRYFYELCAAGEEVAQFFDVEQETPTGDDPIIGSDHTLVFRKVRGKARFEEAELDFAIPTGASVMASTSQHGLQRMFTNVLKMYQLPVSGYVTLGGTDLKDIEAHHLRMTIYVLDRPTFVPMTIRQYLSLSCATGESWRMLDALEAVGLADAVAGMDKGLDTMVAATGYPLSTIELLQLKLASAILARPRFLVLTKLFDLIDAEDLARTFAALRETAFTTVVYFSAREAPIGCSHFLHMEARAQHFFADYAAFAEARRSRRSAASDKAKLRAQISRPDGAGEPA